MSSSYSGADPTTKWRIVFLGVFVVMLLSVYSWRILDLQVIKGLIYRDMANRISLQEVSMPARRGIIYDRNGEPLVQHQDFFSIYYTIPYGIEASDLADIKTRLAEVLGLSMATVHRRIPKGSRSNTPIFLKDGVGFSTMAYLAENIGRFPGVSWESHAKRNYVVDGNIAHIVGYLAEISTEELQYLYNQGYRAGDRIGKSGVERQYDQLLRGTSGRHFHRVDARGRRVGENVQDFQPPQHGSDLHLTIDMNIQRLAKAALGDRRGSVVVLNPDNGEILAMVSHPVFNPNTFDQRDDAGFGAQILDANFPFINRAISSVYPPASTFKVITEAAILEYDVVSPDFRVLCMGHITIGGRTYYCHNRSGHGWQNLSDALVNSCNVYFWTVARDFLGKDKSGNADPIRLANTARDFGLGSVTEVDLPNEKDGLIPDKAWKEDTYNSPWVGGDTMNMAIGQGFVLVSPIQMANVAAMVANRGDIYRPYVLREIHNPNTGSIERRLPEILHSSSISPSTWERLSQDMREVVTRGTGWVLTREVAVHAKTGTGETGVEGQYHDWYIAFTQPAEGSSRRRLAIAVQIEAADNYRWWSSKVADMIIQGYYAGQNYYQVLNTLRPWYMDWRQEVLAGMPELLVGGGSATPIWVQNNEAQDRNEPNIYVLVPMSNDQVGEND